MARIKTKGPECRWCGYRARRELNPSDPVIGRDLYECADVGHCVIRLRSKARMVAAFGKDEAAVAAEAAEAAA